MLSMLEQQEAAIDTPPTAAPATSIAATGNPPLYAYGRVVLLDVHDVEQKI